MRITNISISSLLVVTLLFYGCDSDEGSSGSPGNQSNDVDIVTTPAINITSNSAVSGGTITIESNANVLERGLCWGLMEAPDFNDSHLSNGFGPGAFFVPLTDLETETTYYVRAYAVLEDDTLFGNQINFATLKLNQLPLLETTAASNIESTSANSGGNVLSDSGLPVNSRGVCWTIGNNVPSLNDNFTSDGNGTGIFASTLTGLLPSTTYSVRAYATNSAGTGYGEVISFTTPELSVEAPCSPDESSIFFANQTEYYQVYTGEGLVNLLFGDYGLVGLGLNSDLRIEFSEAPETGIYTTVTSTTNIANDECAVNGVFGGVFSYFYQGESGHPVYVEKLGTDNYSITFCDLPFSSTSEGSFDWSSDGNLTSD